VILSRPDGSPSASEKLIPELQQLHDRINVARQDVIQIFTVLSEEQARERPDPTSWSVGECVDHLCVVGRKLLPRIDAGLTKAREKGWYSDGPFRYSWWGNWFVRASGAGDYPPKQKVKTPKLYRPVHEWPVEELVRSFTHLQDEYLSRIRTANGIDLARVKITSPAARLLRLSLGQWLELLVGHQERHLLQARDTRQVVQARARGE
jgi:hypothetical protein